QILHGFFIPGWGLPGLRKRDGGASCPSARALSGHLHAHSDASRKPVPQPVQRGGHRALRSAAPERVSRPEIKSFKEIVPKWYNREGEFRQVPLLCFCDSKRVRKRGGRGPMIRAGSLDLND